MEWFLWALAVAVLGHLHGAGASPGRGGIGHGQLISGRLGRRCKGLIPLEEAAGPEARASRDPGTVRGHRSRSGHGSGLQADPTIARWVRAPVAEHVPRGLWPPARTTLQDTQQSAPAVRRGVAALETRIRRDAPARSGGETRPQPRLPPAGRPGFQKANERLSDAIIKVNEFEEAGDRLYCDAIRRLYTEHAEPLERITWTNMFDWMEACCDACEDVMESVELIVMKNS